MSPTQTSPGPAGARASTSTGSSDQRVTPTVSPVRATAKTRPVSPESLVVTSRSPSTTRPLDSTIAGSRNLSSSSACEDCAVSAAAIANGTAMAIGPRIAIRPGVRRLGIEQVPEPWPDRPGRDQRVVLLPRLGARTTRADGPQQRVARGVLALDELHHVDAVAP